MTADKKVLVTDKINDLAVQIVSKTAIADKLDTMDEDKLCEVIGEYDAILVRSQTKITSKVIDCAKKLKVIARAGVGVDNIDVAAATQKGIIVVNSPDGNTHAAAEHTIAMMMAMSRNIPIANASIKKGLWERSKFTGTEVFNKTLGIIGLGKIGSHVLQTALALGMKAVVFDPYSKKEIVEKLGAQYIEHLDDFWGLCDYITIHTPKTKETTSLINTNTLNRMKKGVKIINCARGGIIDESALCKAIEDGIVSQAALDVFEDEKNIQNSPLLKIANDIEKGGEKALVLTPHLGASTDEAQINVAVDVAHQVVDVLEGRNAASAINIPALKPQKLEAVKQYMDLAQNTALLASKLSNGSIKEIDISYGEKLVELDTSPLEIAILKGVLSSNLTGVNFVNAPVIAQKRGIEIKTSKTNSKDYTLNVKINTSEGETKIKSALIADGFKRIISINDFETNIEPKKQMLIVPHTNKPNMVALVASVLGKDNINISGMQVSQNPKDSEFSIMIINVDSVIEDSTFDKIEQIDGVQKTHYVNFE